MLLLHAKINLCFVISKECKILKPAKTKYCISGLHYGLAITALSVNTFLLCTKYILYVCSVSPNSSLRVTGRVDNGPRKWASVQQKLFKK